MIRREITIDEYLVLKEKSLRIFVFNLKDTNKWLQMDSFWIYHLRCDAHLLNCDADEFKMMDIGVYPKILITKWGKEVAQYNGIPDIEILSAKLKSLI